MIEDMQIPSPNAWRAKWIWHQSMPFMDNFHLLARRRLELSCRPTEAKCWISANDIYELYVNGVRVGRGPSPSYPNWQYFDYYDLSKYLQVGTNIIAVRGYNFGPGMQSVLHPNDGPGGLIFQMEVDGQTVVISNETWKVLRDPSRQPQTEPISGHRGGFKEVCDGRAELTGWTKAEFNDASWPHAISLCDALSGPWENLIPREIPPLRTEPVWPVNVYFHTPGCTYGGEQYDVQNPESLCHDDEMCAIVDPIRADFAPSILIDFGVNVYGYYCIDLAESKGGTIELSYGESLNLTRTDEYTMRPDSQRYQPFERRGGRYVMLTFRDCPGPVKIRRVVCYRQSYPVEPKGDFKCSDEQLNRIWEVGRYTVQMCMQDHYEDCPWREQLLYCGDLGVSALLSYYAFGVRDLARKSLRQLAWLQSSQGRIQNHGPVPHSSKCLPEYPAFWVISLWLYYWHWGDEELVLLLYPNVKSCTKWYEQGLDEQGLFVRRDDGSFSQFVDNLSNIDANDKLAAEQSIIAQCFRCAASMAEIANDAEAARKLRGTADRIAEAVDRLFWSEEQECLIDALEANKPTVTQITNGLALLYDMVRPERKPFLAQMLLQRTKAPPVRSGYMNFYMVEALAKAGLYSHALDRIREYWGAMIDRGATTFWETFDPDGPDGSLPQRLWSLCHAFCSGPVYSLPAQIAGIKAMEAGFAKVEIAPQLVDLDWVRSTVPTPHGSVRLVCMKNQQTRCLELEVTIPKDTACDVVVPLPGRDLGTVTVAGQPVQPGVDAQDLQRIHANLREARIEANGIRLCFTSDSRGQFIHITTRQTREFAPGLVLVNEPASNWNSVPRPKSDDQ